jgi:hypothetical protein
MHSGEPKTYTRHPDNNCSIQHSDWPKDFYKLMMDIRWYRSEMCNKYETFNGSSMVACCARWFTYANMKIIVRLSTQQKFCDVHTKYLFDREYNKEEAEIIKNTDIL